jgi:hypothetical protein
MAGLGIVATGAGVDRLGTGFQGERCEGAATAAAGIAPSGIPHPCQRRGVRVGSSRLEFDVSIPLEAKGGERSLEFVSHAGDAAIAIEVLNPEKPTAPLAAHAEVAAGGRQQRS